MSGSPVVYDRGPADLFQRGVCHCGHVKHDGLCGVARSIPAAPCDCAEYVPMTWTPCGTVWFYGQDARTRRDDVSRY